MTAREAEQRIHEQAWIGRSPGLERTRELLEQYRARGGELAAIDAIALLECGLGALCDATVAVVAPPEVRVRRIMAREGIPEDYARRRVAAQQGDGFYRAHCAHLLENREGDTPEEFRRRARALFRDLLQSE